MTSGPFENMREALDDADSEEETVLMSIQNGDVDIQINEGSVHPQINHERFLTFYLKYLEDHHDLNPQLVSQRAIRDLKERME